MEVTRQVMCHHMLQASSETSGSDGILLAWQVVLNRDAQNKICGFVLFPSLKHHEHQATM